MAEAVERETHGPTLRSWLAQSPFTLSLSSGFFGFFAHAGMLCALEEEALLPEALTGSSAGGLISGLWGSGIPAAEMSVALLELDKSSFWDPGFGLGLLRGRLFEERLDELLKCDRFEEAPYRISITAFHCFRLRSVSFTSGSIRDAIRASCAYPGLFQPKWINGAPYLDGGIADRPGQLGLKGGERVLYHHLPSHSRWRSALGLTAPPSRPRQVTLCFENLPRCGPSRLDMGAAAFEVARTQTRQALDQALIYHNGQRDDDRWHTRKS